MFLGLKKRISIMTAVLLGAARTEASAEGESDLRKAAIEYVGSKQKPSKHKPELIRFSIPEPNFPLEKRFNGRAALLAQMRSQTQRGQFMKKSF